MRFVLLLSWWMFHECLKKVYILQFVEWNILYISGRSCWLLLVVNSFLFVLFCNFLSSLTRCWHYSAEIANHSCEFVYSFSFVSFGFIYFEVVLFVVYILRIAASSWWSFYHCVMTLFGEGNGNPLQYSCLENPKERSLAGYTVHGVTRVGHDLATKEREWLCS